VNPLPGSAVLIGSLAWSRHCRIQLAAFRISLLNS
jgi:hypothetical protein